MPARRTIRLIAAVAAVAAATAGVVVAVPSSASNPPGVYAFNYKVTDGYTKLSNPDSKVRVNFKPSELGVNIAGSLSDGRLNGSLPLAPVTAGYRAFGFLPTHGTVVFTQVKPIGGTIKLDPASETFNVDAFAQYVVSLRDVVIGGHKVNVGPNCQTIRPVNAEVTNISPFDLQATDLGATYSLGYFQNCGQAQDIINDTLPGADNVLRLHIEADFAHTSGATVRH